MSADEHTSDSVRRGLIQEVVANWAAERAAGLALPISNVLEAHPELAPDLERELRRREAIDAARAAAEVFSSVSSDVWNESISSNLSPSHLTELEELELQEDDADSPTVQIPGFRILRELHRGGQGIVYQAIQEGTKRKVAIKVLLEGGLASKAARRRFEREIEIVAQLKHPNIVAVFHAYQTGDGQQFCVMDYIRGTPLTSYARQFKPTIPDALHLFATVCDAVQYAHQRGIIHRDLKPSNILVDAEGQPKVLDFGLAKLAAAGPETMVSMSGHVVGTLPYMSPEQVRGNPEELDTRTDIYSLGIMLYQVLTGADPYPLDGSMVETGRHILETDPAQPSRTWRADRGLRRGQGKWIGSQLPIDGELSAVVLKTLAKERARRYQSAGELAADLRAYLLGDPVAAKRDSNWYVFRKTVRRHRAAFTSVAAVFVLIVGAAVTLALAFRETSTQRNRAEQAVTFLRDAISSVSPARLGRNASVLDVLHTASERLDRESHDPLLDAMLRDTIGKTLVELGEVAEGKTHLLRALDLKKSYGRIDPEEVARSYDLLAEVAYYRASDFTEAEEWHRKAIESRGGSMDRTSEIADAGRLFEAGSIEAAARKFEELVRQSPLGGSLDAARLELIFEYAYVAGANGDVETAEAWYRWVLDGYRVLNIENAKVGDTHHALGMTLAFEGFHQLAASPIQEGHRLREKSLGAEHWGVADSERGKAYASHVGGNFADAASLYETSRALYESVYKNTPAHSAKAYTLLMHSCLVQDMGETAEADALRNQAEQMYAALPGANATWVAWVCFFDHGRMHRRNGKLDSAETLLDQALQRFRLIRGGENAHVAMTLNELGLLYRDRGLFERAELHCRDALEMRKKVLGETSASIASSLLDLASVHTAAGEHGRAEELLRDAVDRREKIEPLVDWLKARAELQLGVSLFDQRRYTDAEPVLTAAAKSLREGLGSDDPRVREAEKALARLQLREPKVNGTSKADSLHIDSRSTNERRRDGT